MATQVIGTETEPTKEVKAGGGSTRGSPGDPNWNDWDEGRDLLIRFLEDFRLLVSYVVEERIITDTSKPRTVDPLFTSNLKDASRLINQVISRLRDEKHQEFNQSLLKRFGLFGDAFLLKLREFYDNIPTRPIVAVFEMADVIMGSISKAFPILEPVRELKETVEVKLRHGGDKQLIQSLNIYEREQPWNRRGEGAGD